MLARRLAEVPAARWSRRAPWAHGATTQSGRRMRCADPLKPRASPSSRASGREGELELVPSRSGSTAWTKPSNRRARWPAVTPRARPRPASHPDQAGDPMPAAPAPTRSDRCSAIERGGTQRSKHARHHDGRGALHVVVEATARVAVSVEDAQRVVVLEVLPLDDGSRATPPARRRRRPPRASSYAAPRSRGARWPMYSGSRGARRLSVPTSSETGSVSAGMDAAGGRVERELADRDAHAARALVAEAEDALVVGDHDQPHVVVRAVAQELGDRGRVVRRDPEPARAAQDVAVLLAGQPDRRRVDDRAGAPRGSRPGPGRRASRCGPGAPPGRCTARGRRPCARGAPSRARTCSSIVSTRSGSRPCKPKASRSSGERLALRQKAVPEKARAAHVDRGRLAGRDRVERTGVAASSRASPG